jgi:hypothetical protein
VRARWWVRNNWVDCEGVGKEINSRSGWVRNNRVDGGGVKWVRINRETREVGIKEAREALERRERFILIISLV